MSGKDLFTRENFRLFETFDIKVRDKTEYVKGIDNYIQYYAVIKNNEIYIETTQLNSALKVANLLVEIRNLEHDLRKLKRENNQ